MTAPTREREETTEALPDPHDDGLEHYVCDQCRPTLDLSLCGAPVTELADEEDSTIPCCVVCVDLAKTHPCGTVW